MKVLNSPEEAREFTMRLRAEDNSVGLVPTMGALHEGHLALVKQSNQTCQHTVASIFVNPTQFAPGEDLDKYPRTLEQDFDLLRDEGVAGVFVPTIESMYPEGYSTSVEPPEVARTLEGVCRPDHFRGVVTVVMKLFQCLPASHAFFGKKDFQQFKVIEAMVRDLNVGINVVPCETVREPDGLALSSRNRYLNEEQRERALLLSKALSEAERMANSGQADIPTLENAMRQTLLGAGDQSGVDKIDYATIVNAETLVTLSTLDRPAVALIAAYVGETRLIDNRELHFND
jgi:pantoate--beta-alanine ligase